MSRPGKRGRDTAWWLRAYAGSTGMALVVLGGAGFLFLPTRGPAAGGVFQILVGVLFIYAGLGQRDPVVSRRFVGGMGVLLLLGVGTSVCIGLLFGGGAGVFGPIQKTCLVVGIASVLIARRAEPGVLLEAVSAFGAAVANALGGVITAITARIRRR